MFTYLLLEPTIELDIATPFATKNEPSNPIASSCAAAYEPDNLIANDPEPASNNTESANTAVAPSVVTGCDGCNK